MVKGKLWGKTEELLTLPGIEVHRIEVMPGGFCSWHQHRQKWNAFVVIDGELLIERNSDVEAGEDEREKLVLWQGDFTTIPPGEWHRFVNTADYTCKALEIYYPAALSEDIVRAQIGGIVNG